MCEVELLACSNVCGLSVRGNYFGIAFHIKFGICLISINNCHYALAVVLASNDIHTLERHELSLLALDDYLVALTPMEQTAKPIEHGVFGICSALA